MYNSMIYQNKHSLLVSESEKVLSDIDTQYFEIIPNIASEVSNYDNLSNEKLEFLQESIGASLVYVMDDEGTVLYSSNYGDNEEKSLVGNNYFFRPYFQDAINKGSGTYGAVGVTTGERGIYFSSVIENDREVIGVVVIKMSLGGVDSALNKIKHEGFCSSLITPEGIIFASTGDNLYKSVYGIDDSSIKVITDNKQFPIDLIKPADWQYSKDKLVVDQEEKYYIKSNFNIEGWELYVCRNTDSSVSLGGFQKLVLVTSVIVIIILAGILYLALKNISRHKKKK